jgi:glycosyltransferase involved in cell wall biosynthesis
MRILHLTTYLQGGAGQVTSQLALSQLLAGHKVYVVCSDSEYPGYGNYPQYIDDLMDAGIELHKIDSLFKRDSRLNEAVVSFLVEIFAECEISLIHAHASTPAQIGLRYARAIDRKIPVIQSMQGWGGNKTLEQERQDVAVMNSLDAVVSVSEASKKLLIDKGVNETLVHVIPNAVAMQISGEIPLAHTNAISEMKERTNFVIGCFGSICERKNQAVLLDVVELLKKQGDELGVLLIGEDSMDLSKAIRLRGLDENFLLFGMQPNARNYLRHIDLFCLPSKSEGLPLSVLECFSDGVLVAGSRIPAIKELVSQGKTGFLFNHENPNDIAKVVSLSRNLDEYEIKKIRKNAHSVWARKYTFEQLALSYHQLYEQSCCGS